MTSADFEPLCEEEFTDTQSGKKVIVRLGAPVLDPGIDYYCLTEVAGFAEGGLMRMYGCSPFQAISISFDRFRILFEKQGGDFRNFMGAPPETLFSKKIPWVYGADVYQRLCKMVDDEVQKIEDERTRRRRNRNEDP